MKILCFTPSLSTGGGEMMLVCQINELVKIGFDVELVVLSQNYELLHELQLPPSKIYYLGLKEGLNILNFKTIFNSMFLVRRIKKIILLSRSNIIISHGPIVHFLTRLTLFLHPKLRSIKLWQYHHTQRFLETPIDSFYKRIFNEFDQFLSKVDYGNIFVSEATKESTVRFFSTKNNYILFNSIPKRTPSEGCITNFTKAFKYKEIWTIPGRLHSLKGQLFFLESTAKVVKEENIFVVLAGGGIMEKELKQRILDLHLQDNYLITGVIANELLLGWIKVSDFVIVPSFLESFGIVIIEAMSQGKTVISSDVGGCKEIIEHGKTGFLFQNQNAVDLQKKLASRTKLSPELLVKEFDEKFSFETHIKNLIRIIS